MPGLTGLVSTATGFPPLNMEAASAALQYGRATVSECYQEANVSLSCAHLGTGGQRNLYQSGQAIVVFYGYLTEPSIPPGADGSDPAEAAHYIHDLYLEHGEAMMKRLAGAFAFAVWDRTTQTLLLVSDHLGLRPIYYAEHNGVFRFASEIKGILADPAFPHRLNMAAMADFFHYSYVLEEKTFFQDIQLLPPASVLRLHDGHWRVSHYWEIAFPEDYPHHPDKWYDDLIYEVIQSSVKKMIRPELRYGLSLSGGLDSRWIAAFLSKYQPDSLAFTIGTPDSDDAFIARQVAIQTGLTHHRWEPSPNFIAEAAEIYAYLVEGMDSFINIGEFPISIRVGDYVDVSVGGFLGGDIFGYEINPLSASFRKQDVIPYYLWRNRRDRLSQPLMAQVFGEQAGRELGILAKDSLQKCINAIPSERGFQAMLYFFLRHRERRAMNTAQRAKLPFSDIYQPFADVEVLRTALDLPASQLMVENAYRRAMVTHLPELGAIPWTFTLTPPSISVSGVVLKKIAQHTLGRCLRKTPLGNHPLIRPRRYHTNYSLWSREPLRSFIKETLLSPEANATGLFNPDGLRTIVRDHMESKRDVTGFIGQALAVALWTRLFYNPSTPIRPDSLEPDHREG